MSSIQILVTIIVIALTTLLTRALPFLFSSGREEDAGIRHLSGRGPALCSHCHAGGILL